MFISQPTLAHSLHWIYWPNQFTDKHRIFVAEWNREKSIPTQTNSSQGEGHISHHQNFPSVQYTHRKEVSLQHRIRCVINKKLHTSTYNIMYKKCNMKLFWQPPFITRTWLRWLKTAVIYVVPTTNNMKMALDSSTV